MRRPGLAAATAIIAVVAGLALDGCAADRSEPSPAAAAPTSAAPSSTSSPTPSRDPLADAVEDLDPADLPPLSGTPARPRRGEVLGGDVSWPQCPKGLGIPQRRTQGSPMPLQSAEFVVFGLTNGPGMHANPCLAEQVSWARQRGLMVAAYSVISQPQPGDLRRHGATGPYDGSTPLGALANAGYQQALFNLDTMRSAGLASPIVWLDVEPVPDFEWSHDPAANSVVVAGAARGYREAGLDVGVYSTPSMWRQIVGDLSVDAGWEWRPAGASGHDEAIARCGDDWSIQGGRGALAQWVERGRDLDASCPGVSSRMGELFVQF